MNVLTDFGYSVRHYITHPWKFFKDAHYNLKNAWQRITKGYCDMDAYNMDNWIINVFPPMLRTIADKGCAYPGSEPFDAPEKWHEWLHKIADEIEKCKEDGVEGQNEYAKQFEEACYRAARAEIKDERGFISSSFNFTSEDDEVRKKYFQRFDQLNKEREERIRWVFEELGKHFDCLWD